MTSIIGFSAFLAVFCWVMFFYHKRKEERRSAYELMTGQYDAREKQREQNKKQRSFIGRLLVLSNQAGYDFGTKEILMIVACTMFFGYLASFFFLKSGLVSMIASLLCLVLPYNFFKGRINKRQFILRSQFADLIIYWVNSMSAGADLPNAILENLEQTPDPLKEIITMVSKKLQAGETLLTSLRSVEPYMAFNEYKNLFLLSVELSMEVGRERYLDVLRDIGRLIKEKERVHKNMLAMTSQGRHVANMVMFAPYAFFLMVQYFAPDYFSPVMNSALGQMVLSVLLAFPLVGRYIVSRMIRIEID
jgi:Flp pilus assembly protein TadB